MDIINQFKKTLLENGDSARLAEDGESRRASKVTVKNYIADVKRFVFWFENNYKRSFPPPALTLELVETYLTPLRAASPRSAKRYQSSLRKFFGYLTAEGKLSYNPLENSKVKQLKTDPLYLKEFGNYLYSSNASPVTIKNYILDVRQFLNWASEVTEDSYKKVQPEEGSPSLFDNSLTPAKQLQFSNQAYPFANIDTFILDEYKNRLVNETRLSPLSVNRKLSSLRKYISWASAKGILKNGANVGSSILNSADENLASAPDAVQVGLDPNVLKEIQTIPAKPESPLEAEYSRFGPLRLFQKSKRAVNFMLDSLIILSILKTIEATKYNLWKATGKEIFTPLPSVIKSLGHAVNTTSAGISGIDPIKSTSLTAIDKFVTASNAAWGKGKIRSIPKSIYAPFRISTDALPFWRKILFNVKYRRPKWYKKYHSYSFVHYVHFAIVLIFATFAGFSIYQRFASPAPIKNVLASKVVSPGRLLSFQGRLNDSQDSPITRESIIKFAIYNSQTASGSALLWQEIQTIQPDGTGAFSTTLGKVNKIEQDIFNDNPNLYLGISVGSDAELIPRQELANVGLTKNAEELQGLKPITVNNAGASNVILALDSSGNLTIGGSATPIFQATGGEFKLSGQQLTLATNQGSNTNIVINPDGAGIIDIQRPLQNTSNNNNLQSALGSRGSG